MATTHSIEKQLFSLDFNTLQQAAKTGSGPGSLPFSSLVESSIHFSATSLGFGTQKVNTANVTKTITITNTGATELTIDNTTVSGADAADFQQTSECGSPVAPGSSCSISVVFKPKAKGSRSAKLVITDNSKAGSQTVTMWGTGD